MELRRHLAPIFSFFMMTIATTVYTNLDAVMLGFMKGDEAVGYYNAAVKIKGILVSLVTSMGAVLLPRLSYYIKEQKSEEFKQLTVRSLQFVCFSAIPLWIYFTIYADAGITFLSGDAYGGSVLPMQIIMPTLFLIGVSNLLGIQILVPIDRENEILRSVTLGAVVNILVNLMAIPAYGASGAAFGTLVAEFFVTCYQAYVLRDFLKSLVRDVQLHKIVLSTLIASLAAYGLTSTLLAQASVFWVLAGSGVLFFGVYLICNFLTKESFTHYLVHSVMD